MWRFAQMLCLESLTRKREYATVSWLGRSCNGRLFRLRSDGAMLLYVLVIRRFFASGDFLHRLGTFS